MYGERQMSSLKTLFQYASFSDCYNDNRKEGNKKSYSIVINLSFFSTTLLLLFSHTHILHSSYNRKKIRYATSPYSIAK